LGAGCSEMLMSKSVDAAAAKEGGKRQMAIEAYARALRQLPTILADNAGFDSNELVANLRSMHYKGYSSYGLSIIPFLTYSNVDLSNGTLADARDLGIIESYLLKVQPQFANSNYQRKVVIGASEAAEQLIRVDHILRAPLRKRDRH